MAQQIHSALQMTWISIKISFPFRVAFLAAGADAVAFINYSSSCSYLCAWSTWINAVFFCLAYVLSNAIFVCDFHRKGPRQKCLLCSQHPTTATACKKKEEMWIILRVGALEPGQKWIHLQMITVILQPLDSPFSITQIVSFAIWHFP